VQFELLLNPRKVIWIGNGESQIAVAGGGGQIAALGFAGMPETVNPFWQPPWPSLEPAEVTNSIADEQDGGAREGRFLASILGYGLAFNWCGAPSKEQAIAGAVSQRQIGVVRWQWTLSDCQKALLCSATTG
jgi:hypothetical protein